MSKAIEIFQNDLLKAGSDKRRSESRQEYYLAMRQALHHELTMEGSSEFLNLHLRRMREHPDKPVYLLDLALVNDCYENICLGNPLKDVSRCVPYFSLDEREIIWSELDQSGQHLTAAAGPEDINMAAQLRRFCRLLYERSRDMIPPDPDSIAQKEAQAQRVMLAAQQQQIADLRAQNEELRAQLEALRRGEIDSRVENEVIIRRHEEEAKLQQELALRRAEADRANSRYLAEALAQQRAQQECEERAAAAAFAQANQVYGGVRGEIERFMTDMNERLNAQLAQWQGGLRAADYRLLARSYTSLYALSGRRLEPLIVQAQSLDEGLTQALLQLRTALTGQLTQMEFAMMRLGLMVLRPQAGEAFEAEFQESTAAATGAGIPKNATIRSLVCPGVALMKDGQAAQCLVRAQVELN